ncbi:hypothetical protein [Pontibacter mucosus]|nr:hypothetical protein [Pontibacter mucosus]
MKKILQFLFPLAYPLVVIWHIILGALVAGIAVLVFNLEPSTMLGVGAALGAIVAGFVLFLLVRHKL